MRDTTPYPKAALAIASTGKLYKIEKDAKTDGVTGDALRDLRQERAPPILASFKAWLEAEFPRAPTKSPIHIAIWACPNQWRRFGRYTTRSFRDRQQPRRVYAARGCWTEE
ncbi:MAG: transposase [Planctomycetes bacterium]|nr:transposase [Planctomycetota bacterium]